jgi:TPP-dependent pyruvate/acetoin dehydrogenase alpha subunit
MLAELLGNAEGYCGGVGGSMHIADLSRGILGANGIVAAGLPIATGAAFAIKMQRRALVALAFFGDGAANEGAFHEALNLAALWKLPVVYLCENNRYAEMTPEAVHRAGATIAARGAAYGISGTVVDGTDVLAVYRAVVEAAGICRSGAGPVLLEAQTERWHGHFEGDAQKYRPAAELQQARARDPIQRLETHMRNAGWAEIWFEEVRNEVVREWESALAFASAGRAPGLSEALKSVYR